MKHYSPPLFLALCLLATLISCKKEPVVPRPLTASFEIKEVILSPAFRFVKTYDTDSVSTREVEFIANEPQAPNITYEWRVGTDSRAFAGKKLMLDFQYSYEDYVDINLTIRKVDTLNPMNTEVKSLTRTCFLRRTPLVLGSFEGNFENDPRKTTIKIQDNFLHPISLAPGMSNYKGLLLTEDGNTFDTLFLTTSESPYDIIHRKLTFRETTVIHYLDYLFNKKMEAPVGEINVDIKTKKMSMDITAKEVPSGKVINIRFTGTKIN